MVRVSERLQCWFQSHTIQATPIGLNLNTRQQFFIRIITQQSAWTRLLSRAVHKDLAACPGKAPSCTQTITQLSSAHTS